MKEKQNSKKCICREFSMPFNPFRPLLEICHVTGRFYRFDGFKHEIQPDFLRH